MGTGSSQETAPRSQPQPQPQAHEEPIIIHGHSQREVQNKELESKFGRTNSKEATVNEEKKLANEVKNSTGQENGKSIAIVAAVEVKLPHNYEAILREADWPIDRSSLDKLYDQLYRGVFLNQKRKKYWVEKKNNGNCFMLFARDLLITWADDNRFWQWPSIAHTSEESMEVAELQNVCWLEVHGRFETSKLSPGTQYEVVFVVMLKDPAYGWEVPVNLRVMLPDGTKQEHKENLMLKPRWQWVEIPVGEFKTCQENGGEMEISMYEYEGGKWKRGLVVKGVIIRPKN